MKGGLPINTLSFHLHLISDLISADEYPFTKLVINKGLTEPEYNELFHLLEELNCRYIQQKEEGLLDYTCLLIHFAGMLNLKLHPDQAMLALKRQGLYTELMEEFIGIIKKSEKRGLRWR
ncbi:DUF1878 family protein [Aciduricibacillus chroicocephali]|uniref:DUF1878 family protein n=1 Tax=Aciduricibacillus chroicocephali TaxID=3054939 RepID=A0ABY9KXZ0_9BACI|nr:DUF1878 family protein [Bacillaceae bacterium 44XB]